MLGDPILVDKTISIIQKISVANRKVKLISGDELQENNVILVVQDMELNLHTPDMFVWSGNLKGGKKSVSGTDCNMIQPTSVNVGGKSVFGFDRNFILDLQVQIQIQAGESLTKKKKLTDVNRKVCKVCQKTCPWDKMRAHVGQHILNNEIESDVCGYCGGSCNTILERTHQRQGNWFYKPKST